MAASLAIMNRRRKMRAISSSPAERFEDQMVVKSLSVPLGLEPLMEGLTKEVLKVQPRDICMFASDYFAQLIKLRESAGAEYQYCNTTINKKTTLPQRFISKQPYPNSEVEIINAGELLSVPRLYLGKLKKDNETKSVISPEIKIGRSEASTAEIDKLQNGFFETANLLNKPSVTKTDFELLTGNNGEENGIHEEDMKGDSHENDKYGEIKIISDNNGEIEETEIVVLNNCAEIIEINDDAIEENDETTTEDLEHNNNKETEGIQINVDDNDVIVNNENEASENIIILPKEDLPEELSNTDDIPSNLESTIVINDVEENAALEEIEIINILEDNETTTVDEALEEHEMKKRSVSDENISKLDIPEISTTVATPLPSDEENETEIKINDSIAENNDSPKEKHAAIKIQSLWRGFNIRKKHALKLPSNENESSVTDKVTADLINAATVIQSLWRGYNIRKINKSNIVLENNTTDLEEVISKENAELFAVENEVKEATEVITNLESNIEEEQVEEKYLADDFEEIDENDKLETIEDEVLKIEEIEAENTINETELESEINDLENNVSILQETENVVTETNGFAGDIALKNVEIFDDISGEISATNNLTDAAETVEKSILENEHAVINLAETVEKSILENEPTVINLAEIIDDSNDTDVVIENQVVEDSGVDADEKEKAVTFILGADDDDLDENGDIKDHFQQKIVDDVVNSAEEQINNNILESISTPTLQNEILRDDSEILEKENNINHVVITSDDTENFVDIDDDTKEKHIETIDSLEYKTEIEIADEISEDLEKLKAWIADEASDKLLDESETSEQKQILPLSASENELEQLEIATPPIEEIHDSLVILDEDSNEQIDEKEKLKAAEEVIMKALGLQHSGEMHDSIDFPAETTDKSNIQDTLNLQHSSEMHDSIDIPMSSSNYENDESYVVEEIEDEIKENVARLQKQVGVDIIELDQENEETAEHKEDIETDLANNTLYIVEEANDNIEEKTAELIDLTDDVADPVESINMDLEDAVDNLNEEINDDLEGKTEGLEETAKDLTNNVVDTLRDAVDVVPDADIQIEENLNEAVENVKEAEMNIENKTTDVIENIENNTQDIIDDTSNEIDELSAELNTNAEELNENFDETIDKITENVENIENRISETVADVPLAEIADNVQENIVETEKEMIESVIENLEELSTDAENIDDTVKVEAEIIQDELNESNVIGNAAETIENAVDTINENIVDVTENLGDTIKENKDEIEQSISELEENERENLLSEIEGLKTDINEANIITEVPTEILDEINDELTQIKDDENEKENIDEIVMDKDNADIFEEKEKVIEEGNNVIEEKVVEELEVLDKLKEIHGETQKISLDNKDLEDIVEIEKNNEELDDVITTEEQINNEIEQDAEIDVNTIENKQDTKDMSNADIILIETGEDELQEIQEKDSVDEIDKDENNEAQNEIEENDTETENSKVFEINSEKFNEPLDIVNEDEKIINTIEIQNDLDDVKEVNDIITSEIENEEDIKTNLEQIEAIEEDLNNVKQNETINAELAENIENFDKALIESLNTDTEINNINDNKTDPNEELISNKLNEDQAATKIQATWRGFNARRSQEDKEDILLSKPAECDELPHQRGDEDTDSDEIRKAATTIQSGVRGYLVRKKRHLSSNNNSVAEINNVSNEELEDDIRKEENEVLTIVQDEEKEVEITENNTDEISVIETDNNEADVIVETTNEVTESLDSDDVVVSTENHENSNTTIDNVEQELNDDVEALNLRLQNLLKTNIYEDSLTEDTSTINDSQDNNNESENKEVEEILKDNSLASSSNAINLDNFDSSRYDLKSDYLTPRSKNISPMEELLTSAYKLGARLSVNDDTIVDAIDPKGDNEEKAVEYIRIPLQGPSPVVEEPIKKEYVSPRTLKDEPIIVRGNDEDSPEYIYIPLKEPGSSTAIENSDENVGLVHSGEMHDSLGFPHEDDEDAKVGDDSKNVDNSGLLHSGEMHDSLVLPEDDLEESKGDCARVLQHSGELHDLLLDTNIQLINDELSDKENGEIILSANIIDDEQIPISIQEFGEMNEALDINLGLSKEHSISEKFATKELEIKDLCAINAAEIDNNEDIIGIADVDDTSLIDLNETENSQDNIECNINDEISQIDTDKNTVNEEIITPVISEEIRTEIKHETSSNDNIAHDKRAIDVDELLLSEIENQIDVEEINNEENHSSNSEEIEATVITDGETSIIDNEIILPETDGENNHTSEQIVVENIIEEESSKEETITSEKNENIQIDLIDYENESNDKDEQGNEIENVENISEVEGQTVIDESISTDGTTKSTNNKEIQGEEINLTDQTANIHIYNRIEEIDVGEVDRDEIEASLPANNEEIQITYKKEFNENENTDNLNEMKSKDADEEILIGADEIVLQQINEQQEHAEIIENENDSEEGTNLQDQNETTDNVDINTIETNVMNDETIIDSADTVLAAIEVVENTNGDEHNSQEDAEMQDQYESNDNNLVNDTQDAEKLILSVNEEQTINEEENIIHEVIAECSVIDATTTVEEIDAKDDTDISKEIIELTQETQPDHINESTDNENTTNADIDASAETLDVLTDIVETNDGSKIEKIIENQIDVVDADNNIQSEEMVEIIQHENMDDKEVTDIELVDISKNENNDDTKENETINLTEQTENNGNNVDEVAIILNDTSENEDTQDIKDSDTKKIINDNIDSDIQEQINIEVINEDGNNASNNEVDSSDIQNHEIVIDEVSVDESNAHEKDEKFIQDNNMDEQNKESIVPEIIEELHKKESQDIVEENVTTDIISYIQDENHTNNEDENNTTDSSDNETNSVTVQKLQNDEEGNNVIEEKCIIEIKEENTKEPIKDEEIDEHTINNEQNIEITAETVDESPQIINQDVINITNTDVVLNTEETDSNETYEQENTDTLNEKDTTQIIVEENENLTNNDNNILIATDEHKNTESLSDEVTSEVVVAENGDKTDNDANILIENIEIKESTVAQINEPVIIEKIQDSTNNIAENETATTETIIYKNENDKNNEMDAAISGNPLDPEEILEINSPKDTDDIKTDKEITIPLNIEETITINNDENNLHENQFASINEINEHENTESLSDEVTSEVIVAENEDKTNNDTNILIENITVKETSVSLAQMNEPVIIENNENEDKDSTINIDLDVTNEGQEIQSTIIEESIKDDLVEQVDDNKEVHATNLKDNEHIAATTIQHAYRGYRARTKPDTNTQIIKNATNVIEEEIILPTINHETQIENSEIDESSDNHIIDSDILDETLPSVNNENIDNHVTDSDILDETLSSVNNENIDNHVTDSDILEVEVDINESKSDLEDKFVNNGIVDPDINISINENTNVSDVQEGNVNETNNDEEIAKKDQIDNSSEVDSNSDIISESAISNNNDVIDKNKDQQTDIIELEEENTNNTTDDNSITVVEIANLSNNNDEIASNNIENNSLEALHADKNQNVITGDDNENQNETKDIVNHDIVNDNKDDISLRIIEDMVVTSSSDINSKVFEEADQNKVNDTHEALIVNDEANENVTITDIKHDNSIPDDDEHDENLTEINVPQDKEEKLDETNEQTNNVIDANKHENINANNEIIQNNSNNDNNLSPKTPTNSPIDDIDAFLERRKSSPRSVSRSSNIENSSTRQLFSEIDSIIESYGQKRRMSPTENEKFDLESPKIDSFETPRFDRNLSLEENSTDAEQGQISPSSEENTIKDEPEDVLDQEHKETQELPATGNNEPIKEEQNIKIEMQNNESSNAEDYNIKIDEEKENESEHINTQNESTLQETQNNDMKKERIDVDIHEINEPKENESEIGETEVEETKNNDTNTEEHSINICELDNQTETDETPNDIPKLEDQNEDLSGGSVGLEDQVLKNETENDVTEVKENNDNIHELNEQKVDAEHSSEHAELEEKKDETENDEQKVNEPDDLETEKHAIKEETKNNDTINNHKEDLSDHIGTEKQAKENEIQNNSLNTEKHVIPELEDQKDTDDISKLGHAGLNEQIIKDETENNVTKTEENTININESNEQKVDTSEHLETEQHNIKDETKNDDTTDGHELDEHTEDLTNQVDIEKQANIPESHEQTDVLSKNSETDKQGAEDEMKNENKKENVQKHAETNDDVELLNKDNEEKENGTKLNESEKDDQNENNTEKLQTNNLMDIQNIAATTIQRTYRGYRTRRDIQSQNLITKDNPQERKNSTETNKTYTIEDASSPDSNSSDEETLKNAAASKIQSTFRNYRVKRSLSLNDTCNYATDSNQDQGLKINELEDKLLASPVRNDNFNDANIEELKDISEMTQCDTHKQNFNRNLKTRHSLDNSALNVNLDTIPEDVSDFKLNMESASPPENNELETARIENENHETEVAENDNVNESFNNLKNNNNDGNNMSQENETVTNNGKLDTIPESISPSLCLQNKEEFHSNEKPQEPDFPNIENENQTKTNTAGDETFYHNNSENVSSDSSMENSKSRSSIDKSMDANQNLDHDDIELDSGFARDYITDGDDAEVETSGIQSEDSIYDGDESDAKTSPDDNLGQGRRRKMDAGDSQERRVAPLEQSSDINNDTLDIFLSSEELSQGAEMLTSREDLLNATNNSQQEAKKGKEESVRCGAQSRTEHRTAAGDDIRADMETARTSQTTNAKCIHTPPPGQRANMGEGKEDTSEALAATKIQAGFRGYQVRKQMKTKKPSSDKESKRCNSGRRRNSGRAKDGQKSSSDLEERSATKIQAGIRGFLVRKRQRNAKDQQA